MIFYMEYLWFLQPFISYIQFYTTLILYASFESIVIKSTHNNFQLH